MPWTSDDFFRGSDEVEAATNGARSRSELPSNLGDGAIMVVARDDHWVVRRAAAQRVIAAFPTRERALRRAWRIAGEAGEVLVDDE